MTAKNWMAAATAVICFAATAACSGNGDGASASSASSSAPTSEVAAVPAQGGLKNQFDGRSVDGEQMVGSQIAAGTYRVTGYDCTYLIRDTAGGKVLTGVTMNGDGNANVSLDVAGSTVEMTSGCAWRLIEAAR